MDPPSQDGGLHDTSPPAMVAASLDIAGVASTASHASSPPTAATTASSSSAATTATTTTAAAAAAARTSSSPVHSNAAMAPYTTPALYTATTTPGAAPGGGSHGQPMMSLRHTRCKRSRADMEEAGRQTTAAGHYPYPAVLIPPSTHGAWPAGAAAAFVTAPSTGLATATTTTRGLHVSCAVGRAPPGAPPPPYTTTTLGASMHPSSASSPSAASSSSPSSAAPSAPASCCPWIMAHLARQAPRLLEAYPPVSMPPPLDTSAMLPPRVRLLDNANMSAGSRARLGNRTPEASIAATLRSPRHSPAAAAAVAGGSASGGGGGGAMSGFGLHLAHAGAAGSNHLIPPAISPRLTVAIETAQPWDNHCPGGQEASPLGHRTPDNAATAAALSWGAAAASLRARALPARVSSTTTTTATTSTDSGTAHGRNNPLPASPAAVDAQEEEAEEHVEASSREVPPPQQAQSVSPVVSVTLPSSSAPPTVPAPASQAAAPASSATSRPQPVTSLPNADLVSTSATARSVGQAPTCTTTTTTATSATAATSATTATTSKKTKKKRQRTRKSSKRPRCQHCRARVGLVPYVCHCGHQFCARHRHAEDHACQFDFGGHHREVLRAANPVVRAAKLARIG